MVVFVVRARPGDDGDRKEGKDKNVRVRRRFQTKFERATPSFLLSFSLFILPPVFGLTNHTARTDKGRVGRENFEGATFRPDCSF
jgi:hypothetical protein